MKSLFEDHLDVTAKVMDMRMQRQNAVMSNIANLRTPRYNPVKVEFEKELQAALGLGQQGAVTRTDQQHMPVAFDIGTFGAKGIRDMKPRVVHGEDRVDLDKEMAVMAKNSLSYNALATVIQKNFEGLKNIISEGSR